MKIKFYNTPEPEKFNIEELKEKPNFVDYRPDFVLMQKLADKFNSSGKTNIVVIGHGGSVTSSMGIYEALKSESSKQMYFISTVDPDYIAEIKDKCNAKNTIVIAISKSGETITQLEVLLQFLEYELLIVTGVAGPLAEIAHKLNAIQVVHPSIGGRFSGFTEVGLLPLALCGIDVKSIYDGGQKLLQQYNSDNIVYQAASRLYQLEESGIVDVFMPVYSEQLFSFSNLIVQLCHESFGKSGKGQTYFSHHAPESQHHTNQRFFGGRKNIAGWFISDQNSNNDLITAVPESLSLIPLKTSTLGMLNNISLQTALQFEKEATIEDAQLNNIPVIDMVMDSINPDEVGEFLAFWQLYALYGSLLRGVNPFDQPQVESSKEISFTKRQQFKGGL